MPPSSTHIAPPPGRGLSFHQRLLRLIAVFKFLKSATLIAVGVGLLRTFHRDVETILEHWIAMLGLDPGSHLLNQALRPITELGPRHIRDLGWVSFGYAALFLTEGTGLWLLKHWAEWFTVIITGSLIPVEIYELCVHAGPLKFLVLLINIAVVIYLIVRIRVERAEGTT